jgi:hypothetical protein
MNTVMNLRGTKRHAFFGPAGRLSASQDSPLHGVSYGCQFHSHVMKLNLCLPALILYWGESSSNTGL